MVKKQLPPGMDPLDVATIRLAAQTKRPVFPFSQPKKAVNARFKAGAYVFYESAGAVYLVENAVLHAPNGGPYHGKPVPTYVAKFLHPGAHDQKAAIDPNLQPLPPKSEFRANLKLASEAHETMSADELQAHAMKLFKSKDYRDLIRVIACTNGHHGELNTLRGHSVIALATMEMAFQFSERQVSPPDFKSNAWNARLESAMKFVLDQLPAPDLVITPTTEMIAASSQVEVKAQAPEGASPSEVEQAGADRLARLEARQENVAEKLEVQKEIVTAAAAKVRETAFVLTEQRQSVDSIVALHAEEKIRFRTAVILLNHAFGNKANPEETVALVNEHNPPAKGDIDVSNLRRQLRAAIDDVQNATNDNSEHRALISRVDGMNPKRVRFALN